MDFVIDQSKAVIPGAVVSATNEASVNSQITTNPSGYYQFPLLPPKTDTVASQRAISAPFDLNMGTRPGMN